MTLNTRKDYDDATDGQGSKKYSLRKASEFVKSIHERISPHLHECIYYESQKTSGNAPCVELPDGTLAIAPDLRCTTKEGNVFWIEVKDKSQRFYHPDTGADVFQVSGWYNIFKYFGEPVFVLFKDPDFNSCLPRNPDTQRKEQFKVRWDKFSGNPYGGWLSDLLILDGKYPRVFEERSRTSKMYILYFSILKMNRIDDPSSLIQRVDNKDVPAIANELKAYFHGDNSLLSENQINELIKELFR